MRVAHLADGVALPDVIINLRETLRCEPAVSVSSGDANVHERLDTDHAHELIEMKALGPFGSKAIVSNHGVGQAFLVAFTEDVLDSEPLRLG